MQAPAKDSVLLHTLEHLSHQMHTAIKTRLSYSMYSFDRYIHAPQSFCLNDPFLSEMSVYSDNCESPS